MVFIAAKCHFSFNCHGTTQHRGNNHRSFNTSHPVSLLLVSLILHANILHGTLEVLWPADILLSILHFKCTYVDCLYNKFFTALKSWPVYGCDPLCLSICISINVYILVLFLWPRAPSSVPQMGAEPVTESWNGLCWKGQLAVTFCNDQGHLPRDQMAQVPIQPGPEGFQGCSRHSFSGEPFQVFHHPQNKIILLISILYLTSFILKPLPIDLSPS